MDALQWMGAVRMGVQTADNNITPVHQLTSGEDNSCVFVNNKSIIEVFNILMDLSFQPIFIFG